MKDSAFPGLVAGATLALSLAFLTPTNAVAQAFKAGEIDMWRELVAARWDRDFDFPAIRDGREPNGSVAQVLPCYQVLHDLEQQLA